jgi:hypothetical protein
MSIPFIEENMRMLSKTIKAYMEKPGGSHN